MTNHTYLTTTNYWAPLNDDEDEIDEPEQINIIAAKQSIATTKSNKWTRGIERRRAMKLVIVLGATSNIVPEDMNLPKIKKRPRKYTYQTTPGYKLLTTRNYHSINSAHKQEKPTFYQA